MKKIKSLLFGLLLLATFFISTNVDAVTEYYAPSYCPALSVTGIPGVNTHIIRVGGATGKIAYCLDPFGDVPYLGHEIYESDGSIGTMNSSHRLNYNGELDLPGVSFIIHYGDSPLYINDYSGGNRIISSNYQWMPYAYDYGTGSYSVATGNNVSYEDTRGYAVTQYAIWWYQDLMEPGTWDDEPSSGAANYKDLAMDLNSTVQIDPHVKYPDDQTRTEAIAMARESADLACSAYAATHGIYTVSSLPSECQQVYNNGQSISPILHKVISERISWGDSSVDITTGSLSFTHEGNYFVSNAINFTSHNLITDNGVRVLNYSSLPDGTRVILADGTTINKNDLANRALTTGFKLSIPDSVENTKVTLSLYGDGSNDKITFYYPSVESTSSHKFQRLFVTDDIYVSDSVSGTTPEVPKTAGLFVYKEDANDASIKLSGAVFELYRKDGDDLTYIASATTNDRGEVQFLNLEYGTYVLKEVTAPNGYKISVASQEVIIDAEAVAIGALTVVFKDIPKIGSITITKLNSVNNNKLEGIKFKLYSDSGCTREVTTDFYGSSLGELTTDSNGVIKINRLPYGTYYLKEVATLDNYLLLKDPIALTINESTENVTRTVYNEPLGSIIVTKKDSTHSDINLAGAEFQLLDASNNPVTTDANGTPLGTLKTGSDGKLTINNLKYGTYKLKEIGAPDNYSIIVEVTSVSLNGTTAQVTINNKANLGSLTIYKYDDYSDKALADVTFKLYRNSACTDEVTTDFYGNPIGTLKTNEDGLITVSNLLYGTYYLKETKFKEGYKIDESIRTVVISSSATNVRVNVANNPIATLTIYKYNDQTEQALAGIKFNICTDKDCKNKATDAYGKEYGILTTNSEGKIVLNNLLYGTYYLQEVETLDNYKLDVTSKDIVINKPAVDMEIGNSPLGKIKVIKIDTQSKKTLAGAIFELYDTSNRKITQDAYGNPLGTLTTNSNGELTISNLLYGTYILREVKNPDNYKDEQIEKTIVINESTLDDNATYTVTFENVPIGDLRIIKKDSQNGSALSGVVFELLDSEGNPAVNAYGEEIGELTTNAQGEILVEDLVLGDYQLKEIKNPNGYVVISEIITVDLNTHYVSIEVLNVPIEVSIVKKAMDEEFNHLDTVLSGATIRIEDIATGETISEFITSEEPTVLRMLPGEYYFYETIAPAGYAKVPVKVKVRVKDDGTIEVMEEEDKVYFEISDKQVTIYNEPSNILISKFDITNNEELAGAEIVIKDEEGNEVIKFVSTGEEQKFYLKPGIYTLTETIAPEGYDKIVTDLHFELTNDGNVVLYEMDENLYYHLESNRIKIYNGPTIEPEVPDTAAFLWTGGIIIGIGLIGVGIYIIKKRYA